MDRWERLAEARTAFDAAVVELYLATSADAPKGRVESCSCCHCRERGQLAKVDRRTAPAKLMDHFAFSALRTLGDESDLRWFAPRLLDLTFRDELGEEVTRIAELCSAEGVWSETEQAVIRRAFAALWTLWVLGGSPGTVCCAHSADLLTACAWVGIDVRPLFAELLARPGTENEYWDEAELLAGHVGWQLREYGDDPLYWDVDKTVVRCVMADALASIAEAEHPPSELTIARRRAPASLAAAWRPPGSTSSTTAPRSPAGRGSPSSARCRGRSSGRSRSCCPTRLR